ncbi:MAG: hypothetical protein ABR600_01415 [Actinomycetota bacterium]
MVRALDATRLFEYCVQNEHCPFGDFDEGMLLGDRRVLPDVIAELVDRPHPITYEGEYLWGPVLQAVARDPATGLDVGASDPRADRGTLAET